MIISASRRTDIPAFFTDWLIEKINQGEVTIYNPWNKNISKKISLKPDNVDFFVFWTKNPENFIKKINFFKNYKYYFNFTLNGYEKNIEKNLPDKDNLIEIFIKLSDLIGKERVIWRYDPIIIDNKDLSIDYHRKNFEYLVSKLYKYTNKCIFSFVDLYKRNVKRMNNLREIKIEEKLEIAKYLSEICNNFNIKLEKCCESIDLSEYNISNSKCIDSKIIFPTNNNLMFKRDKNQRKFCNCEESVDIGYYNSCKNGCIYCYAN